LTGVGYCGAKPGFAAASRRCLGRSFPADL